MVPECAALARNGLTDAEIAEQMGVHVSTFWRWFNEHPELREAVRAAGAVANQRVRSSLYKRAIEGSDTASIFWLKNREPAEWRDRQEHELIVPDTSDVPERSTKELALEMLGMLNDAVYAPDTPVEQLPKTLDLTANAREETEHAQELRVAGGWPEADGDGAPRSGLVAAGPDPDFDLDPGEL